MEALVQLLVTFAMLSLVAAIQRRRAQARRRDYQTGQNVEVPCSIRGDAPPFPSRLRSGRAVWRRGSLWWRPLVGGAAIHLGGFAIVRVDRGETRSETMLIQTLTPAGLGVDLLVREAWAELLRELLEQAPAVPGAPFPRLSRAQSAIERIRSVMPLWTAITGLFGLLWLLFSAWGHGFGHVVTAPVTAYVGDDRCVVTWLSPSRSFKEAEVPCAATAEPRVVRIHTFPWPFEGTAYADGSLPPLPGLASLAMLHPVLGAAWTSRRRRRQAQSRSVPRRAPAELTDLLRAEPADLSFEEAAAVMQRRAAVEAWPAEPTAVPPPPALKARWWQTPTLRRRVVSWLALALSPLVLVPMAMLLAYPWWPNWLAVQLGDPRTASAVVTAVESTSEVMVPDNVTVRFFVGDRPALAVVASGRSLRPGDRVPIVYDGSDPARARLADPGTQAVVAAVIAGVISATSAILAWRWVRRVRFLLRAVLAARRAPGEPRRYVLYVDDSGKVCALLFPPAGTGPPTESVQLVGDVRTEIPRTGSTEIHRADGDILIAVISGTTHWPAGRAYPVQLAEAAALLNGEGLLPRTRRLAWAAR